MKYAPDKWVVLRIEDAEKGYTPHFKILGSWFGSYLEGEAWRLNSGIKSVHKAKDSFHVFGHSGSAYICSFRGYGTSGYVGDVLEGWMKEHPNNITLLTEKEAKKYLKGLSNNGKKTAPAGS